MSIEARMAGYYADRAREYERVYLKPERQADLNEFTLSDKRAAYSHFLKHPHVGGFFALAVAIHAWQLARQKTQPEQRRRRLYHIPHSLDPRQFLGSMASGKVQAEVGLFVEVNTWPTLRWYFTETELTFWGWAKAVPIMAIEADQLWEYDPTVPNYYRDPKRDLPPEVAAVVEQATAIAG